jgi:metal-responsive CopG/Arc/MetJ family transcriptional regulator
MTIRKQLDEIIKEKYLGDLSEGIEDLIQLCRNKIELGEQREEWQKHLETIENTYAELKRLTKVAEDYDKQSMSLYLPSKQ